MYQNSTCSNNVGCTTARPFGARDAVGTETDAHRSDNIARIHGVHHNRAKHGRNHRWSRVTSTEQHERWCIAQHSMDTTARHRNTATDRSNVDVSIRDSLQFDDPKRCHDQCTNRTTRRRSVSVFYYAISSIQHNYSDVDPPMARHVDCQSRRWFCRDAVSSIGDTPSPIDAFRICVVKTARRHRIH